MMIYTIEAKKRVNSRKYTPIKEFYTDEDIIAYLKENNLFMTGTPYIFSHINLNDGKIIRQTYNGIICSPERLRSLLQAK